MIGQQRNILATLGIDLWIPRAEICQKNTAASLWRDHAPDLNIPILPLEPDVSIKTISPKTQSLAQPVSEIKLPEQSDMISQTVTPEPVAAKPQLSISTQPESFELQMYVLEHCAILVESSQLTEKQQQLWHNIQKARPGQYAELKWPFPLADFQESRGISSYIQGFLDATANHKKLLCLGQVDFIQHASMLHLASLQDMIAQPLLKKRLWQFMQ